MALVLEGFVETSQQIMEIPQYCLETEHECCPEKIMANKQFLSILQNENDTQYS